MIAQYDQWRIKFKRGKGGWGIGVTRILQWSGSQERIENPKEGSSQGVWGTKSPRS